ncbi:MAG: hypothetical protein D6765_07470 [Bacteroidetes bacterium]|nr:MAG: hypothetical protein D6765_07470 [Bacteroidota bacterium]
MDQNASQRLTAIAAIVVVVLLAINAYLLYAKYKQDKIIRQQEAELVEADKLNAELEKQYNEALAELEEAKGINEELNSLVEQQKAELKAQKERIASLIKNGKDLARAREEMKQLRLQVQQYLAEIETLKEENQQLKQENTQLASRTRILEEDLQSQKAVTEQLSQTKSQLEQEKERIAKERESLAKTVNYASVIQIQNIEVTPLKVRPNGKLAKKKYAKNVDLLRVCFHTTVNEIARPGIEKFYVRIINPIGETLAIDDLGSGVLINRSTNEEVRYTQVTEYEYENDETQLCFDWGPNMSFQPGEYKVEIYNKGHLAGSGTFRLK